MFANRSVALAAIVLLAGFVAWFTWPRPSVRIDIARGGAATVDFTIAYPGTCGGTCSAHESGNLTHVVR